MPPPSLIPLSRAALLSSGQQIPLIGLGTWQLDPKTPPGTCKSSVLHALRLGIRHIDTAYSYGNGAMEREVGEAVREWERSGGGRREDVWITTKLYQTFHRPADVAEGLKRSLANLGMGYVDCYLMHFPHAYVPGKDFEVLYVSDEKVESTPIGPYPMTDKYPRPLVDYPLSRDYPSTWKAMEALVDKGLARSIGLSNFSILKTKRLLQSCRIRPVLNQVELHPYLPQKALKRFCDEEGIHLTGHSPLGGNPYAAVALRKNHPSLLEDPVILSLASKYDSTPSQILLSWAVQRGTSIIPKSTKLHRVELNSKVFEMEKEDFDKVEGLTSDEEGVRMNDPKELLGFDIYNEEVDEPEEPPKQ